MLQHVFGWYFCFLRQRMQHTVVLVFWIEGRDCGLPVVCRRSVQSLTNDGWTLDVVRGASGGRGRRDSVKINLASCAARTTPRSLYFELAATAGTVCRLFAQRPAINKRWLDARFIVLPWGGASAYQS